jgi:ankyrin repeat protein
MDPRLVEAALNGNVIELQKLLGEDPLVIERGSVAVYPETALHIATMSGQTEFVRKLLKRKPTIDLNDCVFSPVSCKNNHYTLECTNSKLS